MKLDVVSDDGLLVVKGVGKERLLEMSSPFDYHAEFHNICKQVYSQSKGAPAIPSTLVSENGFGILKDLIPKETATRMSQEISAEIVKPGPLANTLVDPSVSFRKRVLELTETGFAGILEDVIENYLSSFFRIDHLQVMRTQFSPKYEVSFRWHRDFEPAAQLHVVLYLTESGEQDANTIFTTLADSRRCAKLGYAYPLMKDRVVDINAWLPKGEPPVTVVCPDLNPGDAVIFAASRILHRGLLPQRWNRDVILFNVLPSLSPWRQELAVRGTEHLFHMRDTVWIDPFSHGSPSRDFLKSTEQPNWHLFSHLCPVDA